MTAPTELRPPALTFDGLVSTIGRAHAVLAQQATKAVNVSLTLRNWAIGFYIAEFELRGENRAGYGDRLIPALADALRAKDVSNAARRQLYGYLDLYRSYPQLVRTAHAQGTHLFPLVLPGQIVPTVSTLSGIPPEIDPEKLLTELSYSHFQILVELQDTLRRRFYEVETLRGNWSVRELKRQIDTQYFERSALSLDKNLASQRVRANAEQQAPQLIIRDPYAFEFLGLKSSEVVTEGHLEDALLSKLHGQHTQAALQGALGKHCENQGSIDTRPTRPSSLLRAGDAHMKSTPASTTTKPAAQRAGLVAWRAIVAGQVVTNEFCDGR